MRKIFFICFIVLIAGLGLQNGCKVFAVYDMEGTWIITRDISGVTDTVTMTLYGSRQQGYVDWEGFTVGVYFFEYDDEIYLEVAYPVGAFPEGNVSESYIGGFEDKDLMQGRLARYVDEVRVEGTWSAVRAEINLD